MLGYLENIGLAIEGVFVNAKCEVANKIVDIKLRHKLRMYENMRIEEDEEFEEGEEEL